jgi:hypothetical protein
MVLNLETRKPVTELTPGDFVAFPIWEYALDEETLPGRDETWVRPVDAKVIEMGLCSLQVATDFRAASGRIFLGFSNVNTWERGIEVEAVVLLAEGHYMPLYRLDEILDAFGMTEAELFPLSYVLRVPIDGEAVPREGIISNDS